MIVGGYTLDVYCDGPGPHPYQRDYPAGGFEQFVGRNQTECMRAAERRGWLINWSSGTAVCSACCQKAKEKEGAG